MTGFIVASRFMDDSLPYHQRMIDFPAYQPLTTFFLSICMLFTSCVVADEAIRPEPVDSIYRKPLKELFSEILVNRSSPPPFTWLNLYLEKIRSKIFSMDNLLQMFEGHGVGLCIDAILDNIFKFGGMDERSKNHIIHGPAVTVQLNLFLLQPLSYTKRSRQENLDFTVNAVGKVCTILPLDDMTLSMKPCLPFPLSPSHIG